MVCFITSDLCVYSLPLLLLSSCLLHLPIAAFCCYCLASYCTCLLHLPITERRSGHSCLGS
jgi:hypothetical protein